MKLTILCLLFILSACKSNGPLVLTPVNLAKYDTMCKDGKEQVLDGRSKLLARCEGNKFIKGGNIEFSDFLFVSNQEIKDCQSFCSKVKDLTVETVCIKWGPRRKHGRHCRESETKGYCHCEESKTHTFTHKTEKYTVNQ